jgi:hypothetical protein
MESFLVSDMKNLSAPDDVEQIKADMAQAIDRHMPRSVVALSVQTHTSARVLAEAKRFTRAPRRGVRAARLLRAASRTGSRRFRRLAQIAINAGVHHEIMLYNETLEVIELSLESHARALKGLIVMDEELDLLNRRLLVNKVPEFWVHHSFLSALTLRSSAEDVKWRIAFMDSGFAHPDR